MVDLTKLLFDFKGNPTGKMPKYPERAGAKIFIDKFGKNVRSEKETINFLIDNYLASDANDAQSKLQDLTKTDFQYRIETPFTYTHFSLAQVVNKDNQIGYKILKLSRD